METLPGSLFFLIETHPGGGMYDCLNLHGRHEGAPRLKVNRGGSVHVSGDHSDSLAWKDWDERMLENPPVKFLDEICVAMNLQCPAQLPPSTAATITFRFITEFLTHSFGRLETWECRNGFYDTSGYGGGRREEFFAKFHEVAKQSDPERCPNVSFNASYYYWFLVKNGETKLCLNTDCLLFTLSGEVLSLYHLYQQERQIWPLISAAAGNYAAFNSILCVQFQEQANRMAVFECHAGADVSFAGDAGRQVHPGSLHGYQRWDRTCHE